MEKTETQMLPAIGGHFSALLESRHNALPGQYSYESARSGLYAVLRATNCRRVYIPYYVCDAVPATIQAADCEIVFYSINSTFEIEEKIKLAEGDLVLLVDYFGLCRAHILNQLALFPKDSVIVDCSQAWYQPPFDCLATIYSPRKFLPVPDGGVVHTSLQLVTLQADEKSSLKRYQYLLERVAAEPEVSRSLYLESEAQLESPSLFAMSAFTRKIIETADQEFVKARRSRNWEFLRDLSAVNELKFELGEQTPICYPLMFEGAGELREELHKERVFTPLYWPGITSTNAHEKALLNRTLYLPIDHRYGKPEMARLLGFFKKHSVI